MAYHALGRAVLALGRLDAAKCLAERAIRFSPSHPGYAAHAFDLLGDIILRRDRLDPAPGKTSYRQSLALAEPRGMRPLVAHCHFGLGIIGRREGKQEAARRHLATAAKAYGDLEMGFWSQKVAAHLLNAGNQ